MAGGRKVPQLFAITQRIKEQLKNIVDLQRMIPIK